jgi:uncharacterized protein (TIGR00297 family)
MIFPSLPSIIAGFIFGTIISGLAYKARALSVAGAIAAALLGWVVFGLGGLDYSIVLLAFFISSSGLSFAFKHKKTNMDEKLAKGSRRDAGQVAANGGAAGVIVILHFLFPAWTWLWWAFCASLAAATADTWATELGVLSPVKPRLITTGKTVEMGTSGGITWVGTLSSFIGALFIAAVAFLFYPNAVGLVVVTLAGLAGSLVDSALGATIQAVYYCPSCQKETEKYPLHLCGTKTNQIRGLAWLDNDWVNGFCTLAGVILTAIIGAAGWL